MIILVLIMVVVVVVLLLLMMMMLMLVVMLVKIITEVTLKVNDQHCTFDLARCENEAQNTPRLTYHKAACKIKVMSRPAS